MFSEVNVIQYITIAVLNYKVKEKKDKGSLRKRQIQVRFNQTDLRKSKRLKRNRRSLETKGGRQETRTNSRTKSRNRRRRKLKEKERETGELKGLGGRGIYIYIEYEYMSNRNRNIFIRKV